VWIHFEEVQGKCLDDDIPLAKCLRCSDKFPTAPTTNLWRHLEVAHQIANGVEEPSIKKPKLLHPPITPLVAQEPPLTSIQQKKIDDAILEMIVLDDLPLNTVNKTGFLSLLRIIKPAYVPPSRPKLQELLDDHFQMKQQLLRELCQKTDFISYTTDLWKSDAKQYYISIALHFIDRFWKYHSVLVATSQVQGSHTKDRISAIVADKIVPFLGPQTKIHSGVTDGGEISSVRFTSDALPDSRKLSGKIENRLCVCHQLNNAVKRFLKDNLEVSYLLPWRSFIAHLNYSNPFFEFFSVCRSKILGEDNKERLQRDCETRWSSTLKMLAKAEKFKEVVLYMSAKSPAEINKQYIPNFSEDQWILLSKLNKIFAPILGAIEALEGNSYPTQNLILLALSMLIHTVRDNKEKIKDIGSDYYRLLYSLEDSLVKIWNTLPEETLIASLVDPRFKTLAHIPEGEREYAWKCLENEFLNLDMKGNQSILSSNDLTNEVSPRGEDVDPLTAFLIKTTKQSLSPQFTKSELQRFKDMPPVSAKSDPLAWWRENESSFPVIAKIARIYLAIPASQATCERSFSSAGRICTEIRTLLSPANLEKLTVLKQNFSLLCEYETEEELQVRERMRNLASEHIEPLFVNFPQDHSNSIQQQDIIDNTLTIDELLNTQFNSVQWI